MRTLFFNVVFYAFVSFFCFRQNSSAPKNTLGVIKFNTTTQTPFSDDELNKLQEVCGAGLSIEISLFNAFVSDIKRNQFFDPTNFNPLKYNFPFRPKGYQYYRVDETDYFFLIKPQHYNN